MDWAPLDALRDLRRVVRVMDTTSKKIFAEKKAIMQGRAAPEGFGSLGSRMKGRDIMSIMRKSSKRLHTVVMTRLSSKRKHVVF